MQVDLAAHHRLLAVAYRRYVYADLRLEAALNEIRSFFRPKACHIAAPSVHRDRAFVVCARNATGHY